MLNTLNKIVIVILFFTTCGVSANNCYDGKIRLRRFGKYELSMSKYCTNNESTILIGYTCRSKSCDALNKKIMLDDGTLYSEVGKPGFKLCRELGGDPQIVEFLVSKRWYKLDRCLFVSDGSFIDTGTLMKAHLDSK